MAKSIAYLWIGFVGSLETLAVMQFENPQARQNIEFDNNNVGY